ncbi:MAG: hypothetical protein R3F11_19790 [Verrucomicrobiales bacterium]
MRGERLLEQDRARRRHSGDRAVRRRGFEGDDGGGVVHGLGWAGLVKSSQARH